jgi:hypothetical protein
LGALSFLVTTSSLEKINKNKTEKEIERIEGEKKTIKHILFEKITEMKKIIRKKNQKD